jgi:glucose/arabinose dehydrogenase
MTRLLVIALLVLLAALSASCSGDDSPERSPTRLAATTPAGSRASSGAPGGAEDTTRFQLTNFVPDAKSPVDIAFAPDGRMFYAELHTGKIRVVRDGNLLPVPFADLDVPDITDRYSEHGLLGLAIDPDFEENGYVYAFITVPNGNGYPQKQQVVRLTDDSDKGKDLTVILDDLPVGESRHNGGRIAFGPDGKLYVSIGDTGDAPDAAQDPDDLRGKILRVNPDGSVPDDNPIPGNLMWALGLRNTFGLAFDAAGVLWATENGDGNNDEVNHIVPAGNYGWPEVTGIASDRRYVDPLAVSGDDESWAPTGITVAPSGNIYFCSYNRGTLLRINSADRTRIGIGFEDTGEPCAYDVEWGPDGALYLATNEAILRWGP